MVGSLITKAPKIASLGAKVGHAITKFGYSTGIIQHAPEILLGVGIGSIGAGTVTACKATLKTNKDLDEQIKKLKEIKAASQDKEFCEEAGYTKEAIRKDYAITTFDTAKLIARNYIPSACLIGIGVGCILKSHGIMSDRYGTALAAYEALKASYDEYRDRVKADHGEEIDYMYRNGIYKDYVEKEVIDEKGKKKKVTEEVYYKNLLTNNKYDVLYSPDTSMCCRASEDFYGDHYSRNQRQAIQEYNVSYINGTINCCQKILESDGYIFWNDVLKALGLESYITPESRKVGWLYPVDEDGLYCGPGDGKIDLGLFKDNWSLQCANMIEDGIWLSPNVDGEIIDLIGPSSPFQSIRHKFGK